MNFRTILEIENDIQNKQTELDQTTHEIGRSILINAIADLEIEKKNAEEAISQQSLQERVDQAKETGYLVDTLKSNGIPLIELSHTPENHELVAIEVQKAFLAQQDAFNRELDEANDAKARWMNMANFEKERADKYEHELYTSDLEHKETQQKLANAAAIIDEKDAEIKALKEQQTNAQAVEVAPLSAEERETKLVADLMGNRLKVTNIRFKDENGLDRRKVLANNALTSELIEE